MNDLEQAVLAQISAGEMWPHLVELCEYDRLTGSPGERAAMDYLLAALRAYGLEPQVHEFDAYLSNPRFGQLEVLGPLPHTIKAKTRSFAAATPEEGISGEMVYVPGNHDMFKDVDTHERIEVLDLQGKVVLSDAGGRSNMIAAQRQGAVGYVHMWPSDEPYCHEGTVSPVWGQPTPETFGLLPRIPVVQITRGDGLQLVEKLERGPVGVRLVTRVENGWYRLRLPVVDIPGKSREFVLIAGHFDSWHFGATDNATGNVSCMEVARVLNQYRDRLERGVRIAWWPGHSNGRYTGSTWYADHFWSELYHRCIGYINVDSPGALGANDYADLTATTETGRLVCEVVSEVTGKPAAWDRPVRAGDYSFHGIGLPGMHMLLGRRPEGQRAQVGGSGLGWWWHTEEDTLDKADAQILEADTRIYALTALRLCNAGILPYDVQALAAEAERELRVLQAAADGALDLNPAIALAASLVEKAGRLSRAGDRAATNRALMGIIRAVNNVDYTAGGPFDHDPAVPARPFPGLQAVRKLARSQELHSAGFLQTRLIRERNRVCEALIEAIDWADGALS
jgi:N-acetylated-alpha-linked acidic dipeptidase